MAGFFVAPGPGRCTASARPPRGISAHTDVLPAASRIRTEKSVFRSAIEPGANSWRSGQSTWTPCATGLAASFPSRFGTGTNTQPVAGQRFVHAPFRFRARMLKPHGNARARRLTHPEHVRLARQFADSIFRGAPRAGTRCRPERTRKMQRVSDSGAFCSRRVRNPYRAVDSVPSWHISTRRHQSDISTR